MVLVMSVLLFVRNRATNLMAVFLGLFLKVNGASSRLMATFNRAGISVSARTVDRMRVALSKDAVARAQAFIASGRSLFVFIFDNINLYVRHFEQRLTNKNSMINATNIAVLGLPPDAEPAGEDLDAKLKMRGERSTDKHGACIEITAEDSKHFEKAFTALIAQYLCAYWPGREKWEGVAKMEEELEKLTSHIRPLPPTKT